MPFHFMIKTSVIYKGTAQEIYEYARCILMDF